MAFTSSKAILDVIKAKAAGERAEIDLQQALQLQQAEGQLAQEEQQQKLVEERQKAQQQAQSKQQAPTPPDFVNINPGDASQGLGTNPQGELDAASQAQGGAGAQQVLQGLQQNRQGAGGGGTPPGLAQALGQSGQGGGAQQFNVPGRLNTIGFQSETGGGSLAEALGQPRNTLSFQSQPNALSPFQAGSLGIAQQRNNMLAANERARLFTEIFSKIPGITAAEAQAGTRALHDDDEEGIVSAFQGSEGRLRQLYEFQLDRASLENDKLIAETNLANARALAESGIVGAGGEMTVPQILGLPGRSAEPLDDNQLQLRVAELFVRDRSTGALTTTLQGNAEVLVPGLQTAHLARDLALVLVPRGANRGAFLASIGFGSDPSAGFGAIRVQKYLDALTTIRTSGVSATKFAAAEKFLLSLYLADERGEIMLDENNQPTSKDNINKTLGDDILILSDMMTPFSREAGRPITLVEFRKIQTILRLQSMMGNQLGGQLGTATQQ